MEPSGLHLQWILIPHKVFFSSGHMQLWIHETLDIGHFKRMIVWSWTHENLFVLSWSDYRAFKMAYVQTFVRSNFPMSRLSCVQSYLWSEYRAFKLHMSRLSCVHSYQWSDYRALKIAYVQTILSSKFLTSRLVLSKLHMSRLSCVQNCICPDNHAFKIA